MKKQHGGHITQKRIRCPYGRAVLSKLDDLIYSATRKRHEPIRRYALRNANPSMRTVLTACGIYDMALEASCTGEAHLLTTKAGVIAFASRARTKLMLTERGRKQAALAEIVESGVTGEEPVRLRVL